MPISDWMQCCSNDCSAVEIHEITLKCNILYIAETFSEAETKRKRDFTINATCFSIITKSSNFMNVTRVFRCWITVKIIRAEIFCQNLLIQCANRARSNQKLLI